MEGKALLFKYLGGVDAVPICLSTRSSTRRDRRSGRGAAALASAASTSRTSPSRSASRCSTGCAGSLHDPGLARRSAGHRHGGRWRRCRTRSKIVGKPLDARRYRPGRHRRRQRGRLPPAAAAGVDPAGIVACDRGGILHPDGPISRPCSRTFPDKWRVCRETNAERRAAASPRRWRAPTSVSPSRARAPTRSEPEWVRAMAADAIVFACANPVPEIWPWDATEAGARIVATGRSDFPNQVNNSLGFPGIFRGVLDVRARSITDEMALAAADVLAGYARTPWPRARPASDDDRMGGRPRDRRRHSDGGAGPGSRTRSTRLPKIRCRASSPHDPRRVAGNRAAGRGGNHPTASGSHRERDSAGVGETPVDVVC